MVRVCIGVGTGGGRAGPGAKGEVRVRVVCCREGGGDGDWVEVRAEGWTEGWTETRAGEGRVACREADGEWLRGSGHGGCGCVNMFLFVCVYG